MKAFLLAAGMGTRLRPITSHVPKCLVPIGGSPLLRIWLELLSQHGVEEVLINTHYLAQKVEEFASSWRGSPKLHLSHEETLLGSAGTIERNWEFVAGEESFLVSNADNLTDIDLRKLIHFHQGHRGLITMTLFRSQRPNECGIAELDDRGVILNFEEKPAVPRSSFANAGVYLMRTAVRPRLPYRKPADISFDLLPNCLGEMHGWLWEGTLVDIGNPQAYAQAQQEWANRKVGEARKNLP